MSHANLNSEDWVIEGEDNQPLTIGTFNSWLKRYLNVHVTPMHEMVCKTHEVLLDHVTTEKLDHAYYKGMFKAILWMVPVFNALAIALVYWLHKIGVIT